MVEHTGAGVQVGAPPDPPQNPDPTPIGPVTTWVMILGAIFGAITLIGLFVFAYLASQSPDFICNSVLLLAAVFALGAALSAGFIGGAASATGQFGNTARNNSFVFSVGGGVAVLIIVFFAVQYFRPTGCEQRTLIHGSLGYYIPEPATSDLEITMVGSNNEPVYTWATASFERLFVYVTELDQIDITVRNRPLYKQCWEGAQDPLLSRKHENLTKYKIIFLGGAYKRGAQKYNISFDYDPLVQSGSQMQDQLTIKNLVNIDRDQLRHEVKHVPENCLRETAVVGSESATPFVKLVDNTSYRDNKWDTGFLSLVTEASAQQKTFDPLRYLSSKDKSLASRAQSQIASNPKRYVQAIGALLSAEIDESAIINALDALRDATPKTYRLPDDSLRKLLQLTYSGSPALRQAIRNYFLDPDIIDTELADLTNSFIVANADKLRDENMDQYIQLMFITRDIYYNAGYKNVLDFHGNHGERDRRPDALQDAKRMFGMGIDLISKVPYDQNVTFAKSYYGLAIALYAEAVLGEAERALGPKATSKALKKEIMSAYGKKPTPLIPFLPDQKKEFLGTTAAFLNLVNGRESKYLWPDHIRQLRSCNQEPLYTCFPVAS